MGCVRLIDLKGASIFAFLGKLRLWCVSMHGFRIFSKINMLERINTVIFTHFPHVLHFNIFLRAFFRRRD